jgi:uncharacterized membrane protein YoaK (UPF0700 family)
VPLAVGVPLIVIVFAAHAADIPAGKFTGAPIPVAPVVAWVILVIKVFMHGFGLDEAEPAVLSAFKVLLPV